MMQEHRGQVLSNTEMARVRLAAWGSAIIGLTYRGAPKGTPYNKQPFISERLDHDQLQRYIGQDERLDKALQTDGWMTDLRDDSPQAYEAAVIRYVSRDGRAPLTGDDQVRLFKQRTGRGKTVYYESLARAERFIGMMVAVSSGFEE